MFLPQLGVPVELRVRTAAVIDPVKMKVQPGDVSLSPYLDNMGSMAVGDWGSLPRVKQLVK